ncbi:TPR-like protein [Daldinia bambusicola]|nr:TPR-like protein [Daldinia bambusicola]
MLEPGLHVIFDSSKDGLDHSVPEIDIVAVHGLNFMNEPDHAQATWKEGNSLWLKDFLPVELTKPVRILLFSYNSSPALGASAMRLDGHAKILLQWLELERREVPQRPLVFICHSLGGLVVKEALIEANQDETYRPILQATRLLVFFSTPHRGGNYANIGRFFARLVRFGSGNRHDNRLLDELRKNSHSANKRFAQSRHIYERCLVVNFFEVEPYLEFGIALNRDSATLGLPGSREMQVPVAANHSSICKFDSIHSENCRLVLGTIVRQIGLALEIEPRNMHWIVPRSASRIFTGRRDTIQKIRSAVTMSGSDAQKRFVLTGIGGMGKSEVCLRAAQELREEFWGVFWVDVSSSSTAQAGFSAIAKKLGSNGTEIDDARLTLSNIDPKRPWLLILDNADDLKFDYQEYFPSGTRGAVLITSRNPECHTHATVGGMDLGSLDKEECTSLLLQRIKSTSNLPEPNYNDALAVVDILGSHTLAILQAGAYIARQYCSLREYPDVFKKKREQVLTFNLTQDQPRYSNVYATFEASAEILHSMKSEQARDSSCLLQLLSSLHYENMPLDLLHDAWNGVQKLRKQDRGDDDDYLKYLTDEHVSQLPDFLESHSDTWNPFRMLQAVDLLESLALIRRSNINKYGTLSMHPLVHSWINLRQTQTQREESLDKGLCIFALSTYYQYDDWRAYRDRIGPHLLPFLEPSSLTQKRLRGYLLPAYVQIGWLLDNLRYDQKLKELLDCIFNDLGISRDTPSERFLVLYELCASNAYEQRNLELSIRLSREIIRIQGMKFDKTHQVQLASQHELAISYQENGQIQEAIDIFEHVVQTRNTTLSETHPARLASQHGLARAYLENGQIQEAIDLFEHVVQTRNTTLSETHPNRLASQHELARAYLENGQIQKAIDIFEHVVQTRNTTLSQTHPNRLGSQHGLAKAYLENEQIQEAIDILEHVVQIQKTTLSETHPARLASQHELARAYLKNGQIQEAIDLFELVVQTRNTTLSETHPNRLASQHELARAYLENGQIQEAIGLVEQVVEIEKTTLDENDPSRILSQELLAKARRAHAEMADLQPAYASLTTVRGYEPEEKRQRWYKLPRVKGLLERMKHKTGNIPSAR